MGARICLCSEAYMTPIDFSSFVSFVSNIIPESWAPSDHVSVMPPVDSFLANQPTPPYHPSDLVTGGIFPIVAPSFDGHIPVNPNLVKCHDPESEIRLKHMLGLTSAEWGEDILAGEELPTQIFLRSEAVTEDGKDYKVAVVKITTVFDAPFDTAVKYMFDDSTAIGRVPGIGRQLRNIAKLDEGWDDRAGTRFNDILLSPLIPYLPSNLVYVARNYTIQDGGTRVIWFESRNEQHWNDFPAGKSGTASYEDTMDEYGNLLSIEPPRVVGAFILRPHPGDPSKTDGVTIIEFNFGNFIGNLVNRFAFMAKASLLPTATNYNTLFRMRP